MTTKVKNGEEDSDKNDLDNINDFKQFIMDSFVKHDKSLDKKVYQKIRNTEMFLRFCKAKENKKIGATK